MLHPYMQRLTPFLLARLLMLAPPFIAPLSAQTETIIEAPHARTVASAGSTLIYDLTVKNVGVLSATVSSEASGGSRPR